jgi:hypothetical protein
VREQENERTRERKKTQFKKLWPIQNPQLC